MTEAEQRRWFDEHVPEAEKRRLGNMAWGEMYGQVFWTGMYSGMVLMALWRFAQDYVRTGLCAGLRYRVP